MPTRNQTIIRRDINRLNELLESKKDLDLSLEVLLMKVSNECDNVNKAWQHFQAMAVKGDKEREERDEAISKLRKWIQTWRPIIILYVPGAEDNLKNLPSTGTTVDDLIRVAKDMKEFVVFNEGSDFFRDKFIDYIVKCTFHTASSSLFMATTAH